MRVASAFTYTALAGYFAQDDPNANSSAIGPTPPRFGLLDDSSDRWAKLFDEIDGLNAESCEEEKYKLFILGRHGEGFHNVAEAKYGTPAWNAYWSELDGDGTITWGPDAELTDLGKAQAANASVLWKEEVSNASLPTPDKFYSSPLTRSMDTHLITFDGLFPNKSATLVLENCREQYGEHTCDMRHNLTYIHSRFPTLKTEKNMTENDELWTTEREAFEHVEQRAQSVLDRAFEEVKGPFVSVTAHSGWINGFLNTVGRGNYSLPTGGIIPLVVKQRQT